MDTTVGNAERETYFVLQKEPKKGGYRKQQLKLQVFHKAATTDCTLFEPKPAILSENAINITNGFMVFDQYVKWVMTFLSFFYS